MDAADEHAIRALVYEYAYRLDAGDLEGLVAMFEHAALGAVGIPGRAHGIEGARANYSGVIIHADGTPRTQHVITNVTIAVEGDEATGRSYFTVLQQLDDFPLQPIIAGGYHDRYGRIDGKWWFTERVFEPRLYGDLSHHMRSDWRPPERS